MIWRIGTSLDALAHRSKSEQVIYMGIKDREGEQGRVTEVVEIAEKMRDLAEPRPVVMGHKLLDFKIEKPQVVVDAEYAGGCTHCDL